MPPKSKGPEPSATAAELGDEPAATTTETAVGTWSMGGPAAAEPVVSGPPFLSEGIRQELEMFGRAGDPVTGGRFERDPVTGEVTYKARGER